jgi:carnitine-CoA ligase
VLPLTLWELATTAAGQWPRRAAWCFPQARRSLTYAEAAAAAGQQAGHLFSLGVRPGRKVAVLAGNTPEYVICWLALARLGAVMVPLSPDPVDLAGQIAFAAPDVVLAQHPYRRRVESAVPGLAVHRLETGVPSGRKSPAPPGPDGAVSAMFTSGTTGTPRLVLQNAEYWLHCAGTLVHGFPYLAPEDTLLVAGRAGRVDPWRQVVCGLLAGCRVVFLDSGGAGIAGQLRAYDATVFYCTGATPGLMTPDGPDLPRLRAVVCSGIPGGLRRQLEDRFGCGWYEDYGMTEVAAITRGSGGDRAGGVGRPVGGRRVRVVVPDRAAYEGTHEGEIEVCGAGLFTGYLQPQGWPGRPQGSDAWRFDGLDWWFRTGDTGRLDEHGGLWLTGRVKDVSWDGEKITA